MRWCTTSVGESPSLPVRQVVPDEYGTHTGPAETVSTPVVYAPSQMGVADAGELSACQRR